jgi:adhesin transport system outer membrane protein
VETYRQEFLIGQRDLLDLLDSENELFLSRSALVSAQYVSEFAVYRILAVMGALSDSLGVPDPEEAAATARAGAGVTPDYSFGERAVDAVNRPAPDQTY